MKHLPELSEQELKDLLTVFDFGILNLDEPEGEQEKADKERFLALERKLLAVFI